MISQYTVDAEIYKKYPKHYTTSRFKKMSSEMFKNKISSGSFKHWLLLNRWQGRFES